MRDILYEPLKYYETQGREDHKAFIESSFLEKQKKSGIDIDQNKRTVEKYNQTQKLAEKAKRRLFFARFLRVLLYIFTGLGVLFTLLGISNPVFLCIGIPLAAASLLIILLWLNKRIKKLKAELDGVRFDAQKLLSEAWEQMRPLNELFEDRDSVNLVQKTLPELEFDKNYTAQRQREIIERSGQTEEYNPERSVVDVLSGSFNGNPFVFERALIHQLGEQVYHGYLTVRWTEHYRDSKGNHRTRVRSQTLHATVSKPKPVYSYDTTLKYISQGAPDLSFTREGMYHDDKTERQIEKLIKSGEKKLIERQEKALSEGKDFTKMANSEFEVLFGDLNRDHEVQFRMMFTPLAQNNMVDLMRSETGYGDDFDFYKTKRKNIIHSDHAQSWRMSPSAEDYHSYDYEEAKRKYFSENEEYFKSVFFDFAPLMSVPMYLDEPVRSLEPLKEYKCKYTAEEYESLAHKFPDIRELVDEQSSTQAIFKADAVTRQGDTDKAEIHAFSYRTEQRVDFVNMFAGDGRLHAVPVEWVEYIPVVKTTCIDVFPSEDRNQRSSDCAYFHGLMAKLSQKNK